MSPSFTFFSTARSTAAVSEVAQSRGSTDQLRIASCRASATCRTVIGIIVASAFMPCFPLHEPIREIRAAHCECCFCESPPP